MYICRLWYFYSILLQTLRSKAIVFNSSYPCDAYMLYIVGWRGHQLLEIMACRLLRSQSISNSIIKSFETKMKNIYICRIVLYSQCHTNIEKHSTWLLKALVLVALIGICVHAPNCCLCPFRDSKHMRDAQWLLLHIWQSKQDNKLHYTPLCYGTQNLWTSGGDAHHPNCVQIVYIET